MNDTQKPNVAVPRDAATVILLKENKKKPFELFLMRRHKKQSFMGGAYVFPGGALDEADCDPVLSTYIEDLCAEDAVSCLNEPDTEKEKAIGLFLAAVRETFEEAGVLLADFTKDTGGENGGTHYENDISVYRKKVHDGELTLTDIARKVSVRYTLRLLMPYARWITPEVEKKRFDTRFFIARMPEHQRSEHDSVELVESLWVTPEEALKKHTDDEIMLMPPTLKTIEELNGFSSIDEVFKAVAEKTILPILPQFYTTEEGFAIKLPHDPEYSIDEYKQPFRKDDPSRVVLIDGRFRTMFFE
jgi:8-oxo-dGTP pyrophosphatase MutT (NUDIX family)